MSKKTALCIVNFSGQDITNINVSESGFDNPNGPLHFLQGKKIARNSSLCDYVKINNSGTSEFTLNLTFGNDKGHSLLELWTTRSRVSESSARPLRFNNAGRPSGGLHVFRTVCSNPHYV